MNSRAQILSEFLHTGSDHSYYPIIHKRQEGPDHFHLPTYTYSICMSFDVSKIAFKVACNKSNTDLLLVVQILGAGYIYMSTFVGNFNLQNTVIKYTYKSLWFMQCCLTCVSIVFVMLTPLFLLINLLKWLIYLSYYSYESIL